MASTSNDTEWIRPPAVYKAWIWKHFKMSRDKKKAKCEHCEAIYVYSTGNTSTLSKHMARNHPNIPCTKATPKQEPEKHETQKDEKLDKQNTDKSNFLGVIKKGSARDNSITSALMNHIVHDLKYVEKSKSTFHCLHVI